jgi:2-oxoglutarate dehydrogenase E2 component (dihydrolipoamide succinyltransferase)
MAIEVKIPALGESISSGILATWHVKSGDYVEAGQALFDLETDKITSEGTAEAAGVIQLQANEGDEVEVGSVIATIDDAASAPGTSDGEQSQDNAGEAEQADSPQKEKKQDKEDGADGEDPAATDSDATAAHPASVRRLAAESGIQPEDVKGTGKAGRVTKGDMLDAIEQRDKSASEAPSASHQQPADSTATERSSRKKMTPLRRTIAQRLVQAQQQTAMLTTFNEVDMSAVIRMRKQYQEGFVEKHGIKLGFMSFFTKAVVRALLRNPSINARIDGDEVVTNHYYDIGVAVSTPKGLMVPVVRDCEHKSFAHIEKDIADYAAKAREGKLGFDDLRDGVFTITNGGIFGSMLSTPILNTPQSAILGMHAIQERAVVVNGEVVVRPMMYLALSYDHRIVDGREAVTFLVDVKQAIEDPTRFLLEI